MPDLSPTGKRELLAGVSLFAGLDPRELDTLVGVARSKEVKAKAELFHKGDSGTQVYVIVEGRLKVLTTSSEGDDVVFNILGPTEMIGEVALLTGLPRTATVSALEACTLLVIDRRDMLAVLRREPEVAIKLLGVLGERLGRVSELVEDTLFLNLPIRLAKKLVRFARSDGEKVEDGLRIDLKLSQEEWGDLVGATREAVNKQLRSWSQDGLVRLEKGYVVILKPDEIETLAEFVLL